MPPSHAEQHFEECKTCTSLDETPLTLVKSSLVEPTPMNIKSETISFRICDDGGNDHQDEEKKEDEEDQISSNANSSSPVVAERITKKTRESQKIEEPASTIDQPKTKPRRKTTIQFSTVDIRTYDRIIGDNPACKSGPPITFDWNYVQKEPMDINEFEDTRLPRRTRKHLSLNFTTRRNIMALHFGASREEMDIAEKKVKSIRKQRKKSKKDGVLVQKTLLAAESAKSVFTSPFRRKLGQTGPYRIGFQAGATALKV